MVAIFYIFDADHNPVPVKDVIEWARWMEAGMHSGDDRRRVRYTTIAGGTSRAANISTVFLGVDHNHARFVIPPGIRSLC